MAHTDSSIKLYLWQPQVIDMQIRQAVCIAQLSLVQQCNASNCHAQWQQRQYTPSLGIVCPHSPLSLSSRLCLLSLSLLLYLFLTASTLCLFCYPLFKRTLQSVLKIFHSTINKRIYTLNRQEKQKETEHYCSYDISYKEGLTFARTVNL